MNKEDEHIQHAMESGSEPVGDRLEIAAYHEVFNRLSNQPELKITSDLESIVLAKIIKRRQQQSRRDYIWLGVGIFSLLITCVIALVFSNFKLSAAMFSNIPSITGLIMFGIVFVLVLNGLDKKIHLKRVDDLDL